MCIIAIKIKTMKTKIRLKMKTQIVATLVFILFVLSGTIRATEPKGFITAKEESLGINANYRVESWMVDLSSWVSTTSKAIITESEESLSIENWMLRPDRQFWGNAATEGTIQLEKWMIDIEHSNWNESRVEPDLQLESWMYDLSSWATS